LNKEKREKWRKKKKKKKKDKDCQTKDKDLILMRAIQTPSEEITKLSADFPKILGHDPLLKIPYLSIPKPSGDPQSLF